MNQREWATVPSIPTVLGPYLCLPLALCAEFPVELHVFTPAYSKHLEGRVSPTVSQAPNPGPRIQ